MTKKSKKQGSCSIKRILSIVWLNKKSLFIIVMVALIKGFQLPCSWADTVSVPVDLNYPFLGQMLIRNAFNGPGNAAEVLIDAEGCTKVVFTEPHLSSGRGHSIRFACNAQSAIGVMSMNGCVSRTAWVGSIEASVRPVLRSGSPSVVHFVLDDLNLKNQSGQTLTSGIIWEGAKECLIDVLDRFQVDFGPTMDELRVLLPMMLPRHSPDQMKKTTQSLHLAKVAPIPEGLNVQMGLDVDTVPPKSSIPEPALTSEEIRQWEKQWESWDAYITFVVKRMAAGAALTPLRTVLLEILLESRYALRDALSKDAARETDSVRAHFVHSWQRLSPVLKEISGSFPEQEAFSILAFLTACNVLQALDQVGPSIGLEISTNGLRRLARLVSDSPGIDPLRYGNEEDPELRRLFGFSPAVGEKKESVPPKLNFWLSRPAFAGTSTQKSMARLNKWAPTPAELDQYLPLVRTLLNQSADSLLTNVKITPKVASVYKNLVLAAAWQESCWRQYIVKDSKVVPLRSPSDDVGLMQINERVWRGFYARQKLRWDIGYNARAGGEIMLKYMIDYALPNGEHEQGDIHSLARASYSAYNGGPSQLSRYRDPKASELHKKIDELFWEKYRAVQRGNEYDVAKCLGGTPVASTSGRAARDHETSPNRNKTHQPAPTKKPPRPAGVKDEQWILSQNPKHFTLQIAVLGSEQNFQAFVRKQRNPEHVAYYRLRRQDRKLYAVIYGSFSNHREAEKAARSLKFDKPWVRDFRSLQDIIKKR